MAVDLTTLNQREARPQSSPIDASVMRRAGIIVGIALATLIAIKIGFLQRVMP